MASPKVAPEPVRTRTETTHEMHNEIRIADFNFDINGDGNLDPFEKKVMAAFKAADKDNSGTLTPVEMLEIMRHMAESSKAAKRMGRTIAGLIAIVVLLIATLGGVSVAGAAASFHGTSLEVLFTAFDLITVAGAYCLVAMSCL